MLIDTHHLHLHLQIVGIANSYGVGTGPVPGIRFEPIEIKPSQLHYALTADDNPFEPNPMIPYQLNPHDSIQINPIIHFQEDGSLLKNVVGQRHNLMLDGRAVDSPSPLPHLVPGVRLVHHLATVVGPSRCD